MLRRKEDEDDVWEEAAGGAQRRRRRRRRRREEGKPDFEFSTAKLDLPPVPLQLREENVIRDR